jgi:CspA family cold shock protein
MVAVRVEMRMITGQVVRFDEGRGYGFIAPDNGGDDVFVHASELTDRGVVVACGTRVQFNIVDGGRGPKAYDVEIARDATGAARLAALGDADGEDTDGAEVFTEAEFTARITDLLLTSVPQLTGAQILDLRRHLLLFSRRNGWVD